jgi:hypothetical protein
MNRRKTSMYLLCAPNLGILDNWLPVLFHFYRSNSNFRYVLILPNLKVASSIHFDNAITKIADSVFDEIVFQNITGEWLKASSIGNVKDWCKTKYRVTRLFAYIEEINMKYPKVCTLLMPIISLYGVISRHNNRKKIVHIDKQIHDADILLYDIHVSNNENLSEILTIFNNNLRFSMPHSIGIKLKLDQIKKIDEKNINKLNIYLFSRFFERDFYIKKYGVRDNNLKFYGIPRHDDDWIKEIRFQSSSLLPNFQDEKAVLIISSPISACLPRNRKIRSLKDINKFILKQLGINIVIKLHPKELNEGIYEEVFGSKNYGKTWIYSDLHPFALAKGRKLAITLFSGVSFDMLRLGVPCIEYIDLQDIPGFEIMNKKPVTPFTRYGLVYSVSNYDEFEFHVNKIIKSSDDASSSIKKYSEYFPIDNQSSSRIATNLMQITLEN